MSNHTHEPVEPDSPWGEYKDIFSKFGLPFTIIFAILGFIGVLMVYCCLKLQRQDFRARLRDERELYVQYRLLTDRAHVVRRYFRPKPPNRGTDERNENYQPRVQGGGNPQENADNSARRMVGIQINEDNLGRQPRPRRNLRQKLSFQRKLSNIEEASNSTESRNESRQQTGERSSEEVPLHTERGTAM